MEKAEEIPLPKGSDGARTEAFGEYPRAVVSVKLDIFEGPLDLLLFLIKRDEIDITDIPIATITAEYLSMLKLLDSCDLEVAGEYIVMAATLIRIKAAMLLPRDPESPDEEDPREELIQALLEYRKYKEASAELRAHEDSELEIYARSDLAPGPLPSESRFVMDATLHDLLAAFRDVLARVEPETFRRVEAEDLTVEQRIAQLEDMLVRDDEVEFAALFLTLPTRWLIIVTFLALLELARLRRIRLVQARPFERILVARSEYWSQDVEVVE